MNIVLIAAIGQQLQLGLNNELLWHLPGDLPRFKAMTMGAPIVMGRKTYDSIGRPLPGRTNIVLSRDLSLEIDGVKTATSIEQAIQIAQLSYLSHPSKKEKLEQPENLFVIGGGEIYRLFLPQANVLELTLVEDSPEADAFFPNYLDDSNHSFIEVNRQSNKSDDLIYHYIRYERAEKFN